jgi:hypothetical protein
MTEFLVWAAILALVFLPAEVDPAIRLKIYAEELRRRRERRDE